MSTQAPTDEEIDRLLQAMPRAEHADDGELLAFRAGSLRPGAADWVAEHLSDCAYCQRLLANLCEPVPERVLREAERQLAGRPVTRSRWWGRGATAAVVALAATLAVLLGHRFYERLTTPEAEVPGYELDGPHGYVKTTRGQSEEPVAGEPTFLPGSKLELRLRPTAELTGRVPLLGAFISRPGGPLEALPGRLIEKSEDGGVYVFEGRGREIFGETPGPATLHLVFAWDAELLEGLDGKDPPEARREHAAATKWHTVSVRYEVGDRTPRPLP